MTRVIPPAFQALLDSGATTICKCWLITRKDGVKLGFTNHDNTISFGGNIFEPNSGFLAVGLETSLGLSVDNSEVQGGLNVPGTLTSEKITEEDIVSGYYDDASVDLYDVDYTNQTQFLKLSSSVIGEITRGKVNFKAETRGLAASLNQKTGRTYQKQCNAIVGDSKCKVYLDIPLYKTSGNVSSSGGVVITVINTGNYNSGWFNYGIISITTANGIVNAEVSSHNKISTTSLEVSLYDPLPETIPINSDVSIVAGCDLQFKTCQEKFFNFHNFRGFPHIPGNDTLIQYPDSNDNDLDGGSMFND